MFDVRETLQSSPCIPVTQLPLAPQFKKPKELKLFPYQWLFEQDWKKVRTKQEQCPQSQSIAVSRVVLVSGSRTQLGCFGTLSLLILADRLSLCQKVNWSLKSETDEISAVTLFVCLCGTFVKIFWGILSFSPLTHLLKTFIRQQEKSAMTLI